MVSPNLIRRQEKSQGLSLNEGTKRLFQVIYYEQERKGVKESSEAKIKVSTLISRLAFVYEKLRNAVDYDEDHLLRKNAISRILRRQVIIEGVIKDPDSLKLSTHLLAELIRGGYLPNNTIPESKISEIAVLLEKYLKLKQEIEKQTQQFSKVKSELNIAKKLLREKTRLLRWLLNLAACEIEENLSPDRVKQVIVRNMYGILSNKIALPTNSPHEKDLDIQIYLSIARKFSKFDEEMLSFALFKYYNNFWAKFNSYQEIKESADIARLAKNIWLMKASIDKQLKHPLVNRLDKITRKYALYYTILSESISADPEKVYQEAQADEKKFTALIKKTCDAKYKKAKSKLWKAAFRSIIYIFLTKSIFVFLIEIPAIHWFNEPLNPLTLFINVTFPAFLLFAIVLFTQKPKSSNTDKIIEGIKQVSVVSDSSEQSMILQNPRKRGLFINNFFRLIYAAAFLFAIYVIIRVLSFINFTWISIIIFLFFLAFVSFFSIIVSRGVKDLMIEERKENLFTFLVDLFYMPIILTGRWLSNNASKINVFIFIFDFLIEAPFKVVVEVAEDWTKYVRERRDNMDN